MVTKEQAVDVLALWLNVGLLVLVVAGVVAVLAALGGGLWAIRQRRKAWEEYERTRANIEQGTWIAPVRPRADSVTNRAHRAASAKLKNPEPLGSVYTDEHGNPY